MANTSKGSAFTPKGTMSPSMCKRFKTQNIGTWNDYGPSRISRKWVKTATQDLKTLRQLTLGAPVDRLPANIRNAVAFFSHPFQPEFKRRDQGSAASQASVELPNTNNELPVWIPPAQRVKA